MITVLKSVILGKNGNGEMFEVISTDHDMQFAKDRATYILARLAPVYPVVTFHPDTVVEMNTVTLRFLVVDTRNLTRGELLDKVHATFKEHSRERFDVFLRSFDFSSKTPTMRRHPRAYMKLYPDIPHGFWAVSKDKHPANIKKMLLGWAASERGSEHEFVDFAEFRKTYPAFSKRFDRANPDNRDFPPAVIFALIGGVTPYTKPHKSADAYPLNVLCSMQLFSKKFVNAVFAGVTTSYIATMLSFVVLFVEELAKLTMTDDIAALSQKLFGVEDGYNVDSDDYPPPAYARIVPELLTYAPSNTWPETRKHAFLKMEACFLSYCRDFATGNSFVKHAMESSEFRNGYVEQAIGGGMLIKFKQFSKRPTPEYEIRHRVLKKLEISEPKRASYVTIAEALAVFAARPAAFSSGDMAHIEREKRCVDDFLQLMKTADESTLEILTRYITNTLAALKQGSHRPLGWIRASRINYVIMQKWHEMIYLYRDTEVHAHVIGEVYNRVLEYTNTGESQLAEPVSILTHADVYYTLNGATISTSYFGQTPIRKSMLPLLMLDPTTIHGDASSREEDMWTMCGSKTLKARARVCNLRNHLYLQPGEESFADSVRLEMMADTPKLTDVKTREMPSARTLLDSMMGLDHKEKTRTLYGAMNAVGAKFIKGIRNVDTRKLRILAFAALPESNLAANTLSALHVLVLESKIAPTERPHMYDFHAATVEDTYRSMVPFAFISRAPLNDPVSGTSLLEASRQQIIELDKASTLKKFADSQDVGVEDALVAFAVRRQILEMSKADVLEGTKMMFAAFSVDKRARALVAELRAFAENLSKTAHIGASNDVLTDVFDRIVSTNFANRRPVNLDVVCDRAHPYVVGMHSSLVELMNVIDEESMVRIQLTEASSVRPHERRYIALLLSSSVVKVDDRGNMYCVGGRGLDPYLLLAHPNIELPSIEKPDGGFAPFPLDEPPKRRPNPVYVEFRDVTLELMNASFASSTLESRVLGEIYDRVCTQNGFALASSTAPSVQPGAKKQKRGDKFVDEMPRSSIFTHSLQRMIYRETAVDMLIFDIATKTNVDMEHSRISFCFVATEPTGGDLLRVKYGVYSAVDLAADDSQKHHVIAIVHGDKVYITSS